MTSSCILCDTTYVAGSPPDRTCSTPALEDQHHVHLHREGRNLHAAITITPAVRMSLPSACPPLSLRPESPSPSSLHHQHIADTSTEHEPKHELENVRTDHATACLMMSEARACQVHNTMPRRRRKRRRTTSYLSPYLSLCAISFITIPITSAQTTCIPLTGSTTCPAFNTSSISTNPYLTGLLYVFGAFRFYRPVRLPFTFVF